jgi:hypothetical protein
VDRRTFIFSVTGGGVRKLILAVVILAIAAVPVPALVKDRHEGRHEFRGHERVTIGAV